MEDNAMEVCSAALSPSRFVAVHSSFSFKVLRSGKNKARQSWDLRALQRREVREQPSLVGSGWPGAPWGTLVPETRQIEGLAAEALSWSPAGLLVRTLAGLAELTSTCPATHAGWVDG